MTKTQSKETFLQKLLGQNYKWWFFYFYRLRSSLTYSWQNLFYILGSFQKTLLFIFVWFINAQNGSNLFSPQEILSYFLVGSLVSIFLYSDGQAFQIANNIASGSISLILMRPISFFKYYFVKDLGWSCFFSINTVIH